MRDARNQLGEHFHNPVRKSGGRDKGSGHEMDKVDGFKRYLGGDVSGSC